MTLGRCPLSIFCSRGTPARENPLSQPTLSERGREGGRGGERGREGGGVSAARKLADVYRAAGERAGNTLIGFKDVRTETGSGQG